MKKALPCVAVCVTEQTRCENLIVSGRRLADKMGVELEVLNIQPSRNAFCAHSDELQYLYNTVKANRAGMTVYYNDNAALTAAAHIRKCNAAAIVTGLPAENSSGFVEMIRALLPDIEINLTEDNGRMHTLSPVGSERRQSVSVKRRPAPAT